MVSATCFHWHTWSGPVKYARSVYQVENVLKEKGLLRNLVVIKQSHAICGHVSVYKPQTSKYN